MMRSPEPMPRKRVSSHSHSVAGEVGCIGVSRSRRRQLRVLLCDLAVAKAMSAHAASLVTECGSLLARMSQGTACLRTCTCRRTNTHANWHAHPCTDRHSQGTEVDALELEVVTAVVPTPVPTPAHVSPVPTPQQSDAESAGYEDAAISDFELAFWRRQGFQQEA